MAFKTDRLIQGDRLIQYRLIQVQVVTSDGKYNTSTEKRAIAALQCQRYGKLLLPHPFTVMDVMNLRIR